MAHQSKRILAASAFLVLFAAVGLPVLNFAFFALAPLKSGSKEAAIIEVHKGQSQKDMAKVLVQAGALEDVQKFIWLGKITRQWKRVKAGEYRVSPSMTPFELFSTLTSGISVAHPITIREGENMYEVAADIEAKGLAPKGQFIALCKDAKFIASMGITDPKVPTLEGYLFPDTYFFNRTMTASDMIHPMVKHFFAVWGKSEDARAKELNLTRHQAITLASIIEKETGAPQERPMISSVFHNRLKKKMPLQSDPTTIYGMWDRYRGKIHKSDLSAANDYNTYYVRALPIGPISNPGKESIEAALHPADSPYLYFVSHNDGTHQFSKTFEEHNKAVAKFQLDPAAREGKSWRDLNKQSKKN